MILEEFIIEIPKTLVEFDQDEGAAYAIDVARQDAQDFKIPCTWESWPLEDLGNTRLFSVTRLSES